MSQVTSGSNKPILACSVAFSNPSEIDGHAELIVKPSVSQSQSGTKFVGSVDMQ